MKSGKSCVTSGFNPSTLLRGFTIVELLVVIVVIGILVAITIVSYTGISQKAVLASLQSDLSTSSQKLKMYQVEHGTYPASLDGNNCPTGPADNNYCIKPSPGNRFVYGSSSPYATFSLTATNDNGISYQVTDNSQPAALVAAPTVSSNAPVTDWLATTQGDHYGNYYDLVNHGWATVTRAGPKTIYDPNANHIYDVPANYLAMNPWSAYQPDGRGSAAVIEEQRTNYLVNSYGTANTAGKWDGWTIEDNTAGGCTNSMVSGVYGSTAWRVQRTGTAGDVNTRDFLSRLSAVGSFAAGESATMSLWVKGSLVGTTFSALMYAKTAGGATVGSAVTSGNITVGASWQRAVVTYSSLPATTSYIQAYVAVIGGIDNGDTIDITIDAAQLEKGAFATSYIPTTTTAVTRNADVVTVPTTGWNAAAGTIVAVAGVAPLDANRRFLVWMNDSNNRLLFSSLLGTGNTAIYTASAGVPAFANGAGGPGGSTNVRAVTYANSASAWSYLNGGNAVSSSPTNYTTVPGLPTTAFVGSNIGGAESINAPIQRLTVYSSALSSSDVTTVTNVVKNGP